MHVPQNCDRSLTAAGVAFEGALTLRPSVVPGLVAKETRLRRAEWRRRGNLPLIKTDRPLRGPPPPPPHPHLFVLMPRPCDSAAQTPGPCDAGDG